MIDSFGVGQYRHWNIPAAALERMLRFFAIYLPVTMMLPVEMVLRFRRIAMKPED